MVNTTSAGKRNSPQSFTRAEVSFLMRLMNERIIEDMNAAVEFGIARDAASTAFREGILDKLSKWHGLPGEWTGQL